MKLKPHLFLPTSLKLFIDIYKKGKLSRRITVFTKKGKILTNTCGGKARSIFFLSSPILYKTKFLWICPVGMIHSCAQYISFLFLFPLEQKWPVFYKLTVEYFVHYGS